MTGGRRPPHWHTSADAPLGAGGHVFEILFGAGSLAFAIYSWVFNHRRDTNHRIALALTASSVEVSVRLDAATFAPSQGTLNSLLAAIAKLEEATLEARAAWGRSAAAPAYEFLHYAHSFASVLQAILATAPPDKPPLCRRIEDEYGSVGELWFVAIAGTAIEAERAGAADRIGRHVTAMLANVEALTTPFLGRAADAEDGEQPQITPAGELERIAGSAEQRRLPPG